ncbi:uncharacterized protein LOC114536830 [Dendronephthya gigantea]|uniref:uncharacterized protein LOC114536830 n=1 Tax=Dendronephthya gigantea TaxID=151771 RepID=UPI001069B30A|nr:uncharacterized protein LOC114536830 [Dendronephthya gigantea]
MWYVLVLFWLVLRGVKLKEGNQLKLFYASTKVLCPPCSYQSRRVMKHATLLSVNRIIHGFILLQRSSLPLMLILLANDVEINPGPIEITRTFNNLKVLYLNARSIKSFVTVDNNVSNKVCKITLLEHLVHENDYEVICICETWLNKTVLDSELLPGFNIFRKDRNGKIGGGVLIAVKEGLQATRRCDLERDDAEFVVVQLNKANNSSVILYTYYRPPQSRSDSLKLLNESLLQNPESSCIVLVGDFNLPNISWPDDQSTTPINNSGDANGDDLCELVADNFLHQFIEGSTHRAGNKLDLLFCNNAEKLSDVSIFSPDEHNFPTDHYIVEFSIRMKFTRAKSIRRVVFDYNKTDFCALRKALSEANLNISPTNNIDECWEQWKDTFLSIVHKFVPTKLVHDINSPPWIDGEVRHLIRKKYTALRHYRKNKIPTRKMKLRSLCQQQHLPKKKHSFLTPISALSFDRPNLRRSLKTFPLLTSDLLSDISISEDEVVHHLSNLIPTKSPGPDKIPGQILKECSSVIAPSLCLLFNHSLQSGTLPTEWKSANVTPVHKKSKKEPATNYRPISLLPIISKVLERCVCYRFQEHIKVMINKAQHGFLHGRSCVTQLLATLHHIGQLLDHNVQSDVLFLDFAKAFDSVDHAILLKKIKSYGISGNMYKWFTDYLHGRTQRVVIDGVASDWSHVTSGVPQVVSWVLLFLLFINDFPDAIPPSTSSGLYADDTKLYRAITSPQDCDQLQEALSYADGWSKQSNIDFNASKCKVLTITRRKRPIIKYHLGSTDLMRVDSEADLGVTVTRTLSWNLHIIQVVSKANRMLDYCEERARC